MVELSFPFLALAVLTPMVAAAALLSRALEAQARKLATAAVAVSLLCSLAAFAEVNRSIPLQLTGPWTMPLLGASRPLFSIDAVSAVPLVLFSALGLLTLLAAPRRDTTRANLVGLLVMFSATMASYAAENLLIFAAGWTLSIVPFLLGSAAGDEHEGKPSAIYPKLVLVGSAVCLAIAVAILGAEASAAGVAAPLSFGDLRANHSVVGGAGVFGLLTLAVIMRKGVFPFHGSTVAALDHGPLLSTPLLVNGHLGAFLVARVIMPLLPEVGRGAFPILANLALFTAAYCALVAFAEREPRRLLGLLTVGQGALILAGLESLNEEGITGALVHWMVVGVATTALFLILRALEARVGAPALRSGQFLGLAERMPRLAVFFAVCGLALVGIPGTLGFCAEDLLLSGSLETHPVIGLALPLATALNAFHIFRLFSRLFLGSKGERFSIGDAVPRERWVLAACVLFLVLGGLAPGHLVSLRVAAADKLNGALESPIHRPN